MEIDLSGWREHQHAGLMGAIGPLLSRKAGDSWQYALLARDTHLNAAGVVHGGAITALMDQALSALAWHHAGRQACLTAQMNLNFLDSVRPGELMVASGRITKAGGSLLFLDGEIRAGSRLAATAQGVFKVMAGRPPRAGD